MNNSNRKRLHRRLSYGALSFALALGGGYGYYTYFGSAAGSEIAVDAKQTLYTCSMHPHIIRDGPGSCPICGMDLTPLHDHSGHAGDEVNATQPGHVAGFDAESTAGDGDDAKQARDNALLIRVDATQIQKMGLVTDIVRKKKIAREIRAIGHVDYNESAEVILNSRVDGWVEKLHARFTGQPLRKGQAVASIYSPELVSTQEEYLQLYRRAETLESEAAKKEIGRLLESARSRLRNWNISNAQIKRIESRGRAQRLLTIYSPYSGVVVEKNVTEGAFVKAGTDLFKIVDLSTVWTYVHIPEKDIPFVAQGMPAKMEIPQLPGESFAGRVNFVFPFLDMESRDLKIRVSFQNPGFKLKPGMYATIALNRELSGEHLVVPSSAVIRSGTRELVFVYHGNGSFEAREVQTGVADGDEGVQVLRGLVEEEAVVVSGQFLLDSESRLQEVVRKMRGPGGGSTAAPASDAGGHEH